ncbi:MAG: RluA family pseudouridine synthase [Spirochaetaceae bacterium]|nr:MAG: RluA family pseudouridine synthase [Spirochaetaceae bacterium]
MSSPTSRNIEVEIPSNIPKDTRIDAYIADVLKLFSRSQVKRRVTALRLNGTTAKSSKHLLPGDRLEITYTDAPELRVEAEAIDLCILYEDRNVLVIDKAQGMVVHPAGGNWSGTLVNALLWHCKDLKDGFALSESRPGIVHRLDKDTSGVIIAAKNAETREFLSGQFRRRSVQKRYLAIVEGSLPAGRGRIDTWHARDPHHRKRFTSLLPDSRSAGGRRALSFFRELKRINGFTLVALRPRTGRTHQLRMHMAHLGCPIVGDRLYGWKARGRYSWPLMLHAHRLRLILPGEHQPRTFEAPIPARFEEFYNFCSR